MTAKGEAALILEGGFKDEGDMVPDSKEFTLLGEFSEQMAENQEGNRRGPGPTTR